MSPEPQPAARSAPARPAPARSAVGGSAPARPAPDIRPLMAGFPSGVGVVTTFAGDGSPRGMTCTSLCSVSLDPPVLLVCLGTGSHTLKAVRESGSFAVNLLHAHGRQAAELFASGAPDRFDRVAWRAGAGDAGPHLTEDAHIIADCSVVGDQVVGDHAVLLGEVRAAVPVRRERPLLYGLRRFSVWPHPVDAARPVRDAVG
ncbi:MULTISPECIES: flavin reductase family protein [Streptomyces]|uniref:flavin reductase family protein n=1 Tax=Streptomyces TaxID=1883 RepID=UPI00211D9E35|nr:flavin reductase family protein [Streptomyces sp. or3]WTC72577.1 flavin reductase family protein [Streptomyces anulatus]WUD90017.1 flavin reductase family protein [Streptomyces anulatus]